MQDLDVFTAWLISCAQYVGLVVFSQWGILGIAIFSIPILRKLVKIFSDTF